MSPRDERWSNGQSIVGTTCLLYRQRSVGWIFKQTSDPQTHKCSGNDHLQKSDDGAGCGLRGQGQYPTDFLRFSRQSKQRGSRWGFEPAFLALRLRVAHRLRFERLARGPGEGYR